VRIAPGQDCSPIEQSARSGHVGRNLADRPVDVWKFVRTRLILAQEYKTRDDAGRVGKQLADS
jgi:hypothetical protein